MRTHTAGEVTAYLAATEDIMNLVDAYLDALGVGTARGHPRRADLREAIGDLAEQAKHSLNAEELVGAGFRL